MMIKMLVALVVASMLVLVAHAELENYPMDGCIHGYDVKFGDLRAPLITFHYEENNIWVNPYTRKQYLVPDEVIVVNNPHAELQSNEDSFHNVSEFIEISREWHSVGIDVGVFGFAYAKETGTIDSLFTNDTKLVMMYRQNYGMYSVSSWPLATLDTSDSKLFQFFDQMPEQCETDDHIAKWMTFVKLFGTHYVHHSDFGGSLNYYVGVDSYLTETYHEEWIHEQMSIYVRWANFNLGIGGGQNEDTQENDIDFTKHIIAQTEWIGGNVESSSDDYTEWVATVEENPTMLYPVLHDLAEVLPAGDKRNCFAKVADKYLNTAEDDE